MQNEAMEVLERLRRSTAQPKLTVHHILALVAEYNKLGHNRFEEEVRQVLSFKEKKKIGTNSASPLLGVIAALQTKTKMDRKTFLAHVIKKIIEDNHNAPRLAKSKQTLPQLVAFYEPKIGKENLIACASAVADKHSFVH